MMRNLTNKMVRDLQEETTSICFMLLKTYGLFDNAIVLGETFDKKKRKLIYCKVAKEELTCWPNYNCRTCDLQDTNHQPLYQYPKAPSLKGPKYNSDEGVKITYAVNCLASLLVDN